MQNLFILTRNLILFIFTAFFVLFFFSCSMTAAQNEERTGQAVKMGTIAGCTVPSGVGTIGIVGSRWASESLIAPFSCPNPYHHAKQINNANGKP
jgi:hypothetical protein